MTVPDPGAGEVVVEVDDGVATLWLNRPAKRNALTYGMWRALPDRCRALAGDPSVRVLVVRGVGDHFCGGADIAGLADVSPADYEAANTAAEDALATFPKPTVAAIRGACVGGGVEIAVACDLRLADETARFGITPARLGIVYPASAVARAATVLGPSALKHLLYSAELIDASRALRIGLVDEVLAGGALEGRVAELADRMARQRSLLTQMAAKEMVDQVTARGAVDPEAVARWQAEVATSSDPVEGVVAFLEGRPPHFTWPAG